MARRSESTSSASRLLAKAPDVAYVATISRVSYQLCRPSDGMARRPVDPSWPVVRPDCLPKLLMSHKSQQRVQLYSGLPESAHGNSELVKHASLVEVDGMSRNTGQYSSTGAVPGRGAWPVARRLEASTAAAIVIFSHRANIFPVQGCSCAQDHRAPKGSTSEPTTFKLQ